MFGNEYTHLQEDLDNLKKWSGDTWLLAFHPDKCTVLRLGNSTDETYDYKLDHSPLKHTHSEKDLV